MHVTTQGTVEPVYYDRAVQLLVERITEAYESGNNEQLIASGETLAIVARLREKDYRNALL